MGENDDGTEFGAAKKIKYIILLIIVIAYQFAGIITALY
jgi:hypothetical protein